MDWSQIWPVIGVGGGGTRFLTVSEQEFRKWRSGVADVERAENTDLKSIADKAVLMREWSDESRRVISENASK